MNDTEQKLLSILPRVRVPGRYVGGEWNAVVKDPSTLDFRTVLCFPDVYEVGMSHIGMIILYHLLNESSWHGAERCFTPWPDMGAALSEEGIPLLSLETATPLREFDVVGFSLQHELLYTNVLYMLELARIPLASRDRSESDPLIVAGGCGAMSPEPLADAIDLFLPGDGEEALPAVCSLLRRLKRDGATRTERLLAVARAFDFAYAPAFYSVGNGSGGSNCVPRPTVDGVGETIRPALVADLENAYFPEAPVQAGVRAVHDRISLEIMRGCTRGCRFCNAGMCRRPVRVRSRERLAELAEKIYANTGYNEISLLSLSSSDYPGGIEPLMLDMNERFAPRRVGVSLPSLRVDDKLERLPEMAALVRKSGLTLAPEVASDALRGRINKEITNDDLLAGALKAFEHGWRHVKLYFMIGLPGETDEDVRAIGKLTQEISLLRRKTGRGAAKVNVSVSTFIPKPHTPFQWCAMAREDEIAEKRRLILGMGLPQRIRFSFHDDRMTLVEGLLARGDRRMFPALREARRRGCLFDAWSESMDGDKWRAALETAGIDTERELYRERAVDEPLPWDHVRPGPSREFLAAEWERARSGESTPWCRDGRCHHCGVDPSICSEAKNQTGTDHEIGS